MGLGVNDSNLQNKAISVPVGTGGFPPYIGGWRRRDSEGGGHVVLPSGCRSSLLRGQLT